MPQTHDLGRFFMHRIYLVADAPLIHIAHTQEIDDPFRNSQSVVTRLWPSRHGIVLGLWKSSGLTEVEALCSAISAHDTDALDDDGHLLRPFWDV
jgi:hypothetical protein